MRLIFDKIWFKDHQKGLLFLLNVPVIKYWFRLVVGVDKKEPVVHIDPSGFSYYMGLMWTKKKGIKHTFSYQARSGNDFQKALFKNLKPLWFLCHQWDMLIANPLRPAWNLGFDTYEKQSDTGSGGGGTVDGGCYTGTAGTWAQIIAQGGDTAPANNLASGNLIYTAHAGGSYTRLDRYEATLDITGYLVVGTKADIESVKWEYYPTEINDDAGSQEVALVTSAPANDDAIVAGDFDSVDGTIIATNHVIDNITINQLNAFNFNATGETAVDTALDGDKILRIGTMLGAEITTTDPSLADGEYILTVSDNVDHATAGRKPRLTITYSSAVETTGNFTAIPIKITIPAMTATTQVLASFTAIPITITIQAFTAVQQVLASFTALPIKLTVQAFTAIQEVEVIASFVAIPIKLTIQAFTAATQVLARFTPLSILLKIPAMVMSFKGFVKGDKPTSSFSSVAKPTEGFSKTAKPTDGWDKQAKP